MNNIDKTYSEYEINLKEFILKLWRGKIIIIIFCFFSIFLGSVHLQSEPRLYTVSYKLKPVGESNQKKGSMSGLRGFASLAGIQLPTGSANDFMIFQELLTSIEVSELILENKELIKKIYVNEWNLSSNSFIEPPKSKTRNHISNFKRVLTGNNYTKYIPPNPQRLANYISNNIRISEDKRTGFLNLSSETSNPKLMLSLIVATAEASDKIMRQRYINFSEEPLAFYKAKLSSSRSREHREALAELISTEEQKLMFASRGKYFIAEPYINPIISLYPTSPKASQILFLSLVCGLILGSGIVLIRNVKPKVSK